MSEIYYGLRYKKPDESDIGAAQPNWIGIWNDRAIAEDLRARSGTGGKTEIVLLIPISDAKGSD